MMKSVENYRWQDGAQSALSCTRDILLWGKEWDCRRVENKFSSFPAMNTDQVRPNVV